MPYRRTFLCRISRTVKTVRWKASSEVTKVPLAESRRLFVTESKSLEYMERKEKDGEVQGEVRGEVEQLREKRSSWMVCG